LGIWEKNSENRRGDFFDSHYSTVVETYYRVGVSWFGHGQITQ